MKQENTSLGAGLKLKVTLTELGEDIHLQDCTYTLEFTAGSKSKTFHVDGESRTRGITVIDEDTVAVALDTSELDTGDLYLKATVNVPDLEFPSGLRTEIIHHNLHRSIV